MADLSEYTTLQQKIIKEIVTNDKGFHTNFMIADLPFYNMLDELENGQLTVKPNVSCSLSTGSLDYDLQINYSKEQDCWFFKLSKQGEDVRGIVHYNTVYNPMGEVAFAILNDNVSDTDLSASLPYSNVLVLRK